MIIAMEKDQILLYYRQVCIPYMYCIAGNFRGVKILFNSRNGGFRE